jgi:hypothetical protein
MDAMEKYCCCVAGSRILVDDFKVTWNYRFSDPTWAQAEAEFLYEELVSMLKDRGLQVRTSHGWWASVCWFVGQLARPTFLHFLIADPAPHVACCVLLAVRSSCAPSKCRCPCVWRARVPWCGMC